MFSSVPHDLSCIDIALFYLHGESENKIPVVTSEILNHIICMCKEKKIIIIIVKKRKRSNSKFEIDNINSVKQ